MHGCTVVIVYFYDSVHWNLGVDCNIIILCLKSCPLFCTCVWTINASQCEPLSVSVSDSSPAHGESQDEVLRRRHGDKEVNLL